MKQMHLFEQPDLQKQPEITLREQHHYKLFVDGAARNNPGDAGAGLYIVKDGQPLEKRGFYLGVRTNNQAEYLALLLGIFFVKKHMKPGDELQIISDSELLVRQIKGEYRVKHTQLQQFHAFFKELLNPFAYSIGHVLREENSQADAMANYGIDKKIYPPEDFISLLRQHEILW